MTTWTEAAKDYTDDLRRRGRCAEYVYINERRLNKMAAACNWKVLADVTSKAIVRWLAKAPISQQTGNQFIILGRAFFDVAIEQRLVKENPFRRVRLAKPGEQVRKRRALSAEELGRLLAAAGPRRLAYLFAALTGLRRNELAQLLWSDLHLGEKPHVSLRAEASKSRRAEIVPLAEQLVKELLLAVLSSIGLVFSGIPSMDEWRADLQAAGIPFENERGQADFHSLRKSFCVMLALAGTPVPTAQKLMRHKSPLLTMKVYMDLGLFEEGDWVNKLPKLGG